MPKGLWKSIEHMKRGEQSKIKIMPGEYSFHPDLASLYYYDANSEVTALMQSKPVFFLI